MLSLLPLPLSRSKSHSRDTPHSLVIITVKIITILFIIIIGSNQTVNSSAVTHENTRLAGTTSTTVL